MIVQASRCMHKTFSENQFCHEGLVTPMATNRIFKKRVYPYIKFSLPWKFGSVYSTGILY